MTNQGLLLGSATELMYTHRSPLQNSSSCRETNSNERNAIRRSRTLSKSSTSARIEMPNDVPMIPRSSHTSRGGDAKDALGYNDSFRNRTEVSIGVFKFKQDCSYQGEALNVPTAF